MASGLAGLGGRGAGRHATVYVGGLAEEVTEAVLHAVFVPFGEVKDVSLPFDHKAGKGRGFGFVEFAEAEDAAEAIDNMHNAELYGRVLNVNSAAPLKGKGGGNRAIWEEQEEPAARPEAAQPGPAGGAGPDPMQVAEAEAKEAVAAGQ